MAPLNSARFHGRNGKLLVGLASGTAAPSPVAFTSSFTIDNQTDKVEVTAFADNNKQYVVGLADDKGTFAGFSDIAGDGLYAASRDSVARRFYFYPDFVNAVGTYFFGAAFFDLSSNYSVSAGAAVSGNWVAASDISRVLSS